MAERQTISLTPIGGALRARVDGIDLARPLDDGAISTLRQAFLEHLVLLFHITRVTRCRRA